MNVLRARPWFRWHLSTCVVMMLVASGLVYGNVVWREGTRTEELGIETKGLQQGWPIAYRYITFTTSFIGPDGEALEIPVEIVWRPLEVTRWLILDITVGLVLTALAGLIVERLMFRSSSRM